jgi:CheY-like chemotaxis protein
MWIVDQITGEEIGNETMNRILVVDDDATIRHFMRSILESEGYEIVEAYNGYEGLKRYQEAPAEVVITDMQMPGKNGLELIQDLQRDFPRVKIIAVFGNGRRFLELLHRLGVQYAFEKPFCIPTLLDAVEQLVSN